MGIDPWVSHLGGEIVSHNTTDALGVYFHRIEVEEHNYDITYEYCKNTVIVDVGRDLQLQGGSLICVNYWK